jgi:hypothetical protein
MALRRMALAKHMRETATIVGSWKNIAVEFHFTDYVNRLNDGTLIAYHINRWVESYQDPRPPAMYSESESRAIFSAPPEIKSLVFLLLRPKLPSKHHRMVVSITDIIR